MVSAALYAVEGGWRTFREGEGPTRAQHVKRRVRGELIDAVKAQEGLREREPLLLDAAEEDDDRALRASVADTILASPFDQVLQRERIGAVDRAVARLSPVERRVYALRFREGRPWKEVASTLHLSERMAELHGQHVRDKLAAALSGWDQGEAG
jgi:RNA polymerase sigma factor (sigma-70 family)